MVVVVATVAVLFLQQGPRDARGPVGRGLSQSFRERDFQLLLLVVAVEGGDLRDLAEEEAERLILARKLEVLVVHAVVLGGLRRLAVARIGALEEAQANL